VDRLGAAAEGAAAAPTAAELGTVFPRERAEATRPKIAATQAAAPRPSATFRERICDPRSRTAGEPSVSIVAAVAGAMTDLAPFDECGVDRTPLRHAGALSRIRVISSSIASAL
jgi:hypothetical protein